MIHWPQQVVQRIGQLNDYTLIKNFNMNIKGDIISMSLIFISNGEPTRLCILKKLNLVANIFVVSMDV